MRVFEKVFNVVVYRLIFGKFVRMIELFIDNLSEIWSILVYM